MVDVLTIDYETRSPVDIKRCGAYAYAESPYTEVMVLAIKEDNKETRMWIAPQFRALMETEVSDEELKHLIKEANVLVAHNAFFERQISHFKMPFELPIQKVRCTMAQSAMCGLPLNLDEAAKHVSGNAVLKDKEGHNLMMKMSKPRQFVKKEYEELLPTLIAEGFLSEDATYKDVKNLREEWLSRMAVHNMQPYDDALCKYFLKYKEDKDSFIRLVEYARQDVRVEYVLYKKLPKIPEMELRVWRLDQEINDRGVMVDLPSVVGIENTIKEYSKELSEEALEITNHEVTSIKSTPSILKWLRKKGLDVDSVDKESVSFLLSLDLAPDVKRFLQLRKELNKASFAKYAAMQSFSASDSRLHGMFVYHGATTGRFASRGCQIHNLPRPKGAKNLVDAELYTGDVYADETDAHLLAAGDISVVQEFWKDPMVLSADLIRTMFVAPEGKDFICADFSAVEARGIAWLSGQESTLDAFRKELDIYKVAASGIYKIPYEQVDGGGKGDQRQIGKTATLACVSKDTFVITDQGPKRICEMYSGEKVWDGEEWVSYERCASRGVREVQYYKGVFATPDHLWLVNGEWKRTDELTGRDGVEDIDGIDLVYDLVNCGPRHRYAVLSDDGGYLICHNCGFGGGVGALKRFGADRLGLSELEMKNIIKGWRESNSFVVKWWHSLTRAAMLAMKFPGERFNAGKYVTFRKEGDFLTAQLPSGRNLYYPSPKIEEVIMPWEDENGNPVFQKAVTSLTQLAISKQWVREPLSHVKLSENVTQATCRDLLINALYNVQKKDYDVVMHVHDEIIAEVDEGKGSLEEFETLMATPPEWAKGFPLKAEGWRGKRYKK